MGSKNFKDHLVCVKCRGRLIDNIDNLTCQTCGCHYPVISDIPDFRDTDEYWCNVSREKMRELNGLAKSSGDWFGAAKSILRQYAEHVAPFHRADAQFLWPCNKDSKILDAGSMWGGITIPAAQFCSEVYAVDKTIETLEFLKIRAQQMGFENICTVACGLQKLPFPDNFFDLVVLNGVLEWVALGERIILEKHWRKFGLGLKPENSVRYAQNPRTTQLEVLHEIRRVLKPGGCLYLAIENRIGYIYLAGFPDDHMNIPFICFLPRLLSNAITKLMLNCEYRTYVYSIPGYKALLKESGFQFMDFYGAFTHYINPSEIIPLDLIRNLKDMIVSTKRGINKILLRMIPRDILKWLSPSVIIIAAKDAGYPNDKPRLVQLLDRAGLLSSDHADIRIIKCGSRSGDDLTVNYMVYYRNERLPKYFCKICRSKSSTAVLDTEAKNLKLISELLKKTKLVSNITSLLYYGTIDDITFMVMDFIEARKSAFDFNDKLKTKMRCLDREVRMAIKFLVDFQKHTTVKNVKAVPCLLSFLESSKKTLDKSGLLTNEIEASIRGLSEEIKGLGDITMPLCSQHGDYDFFYNISFKDDAIRLLDFEHFKCEALPFLDLGTVIFNPVLVSYEYKKKGMSLGMLLGKHNLRNHIIAWLNLYAELSGLPKQLICLAPALAALEQKTMNYPDYRKPDTFPINSAFQELLSLRIND